MDSHMASMMETVAFYDEVEGVVNELQPLLEATSATLDAAGVSAVLQARELLMLAATVLFEEQNLHLGFLKRYGRLADSSADN